MLYEIAVDDRIYVVRLDLDGEGRFEARLEDREVRGTWSPGHLVVEGESLEYAVASDAAGQPREIAFRGQGHQVAVLGMGFRRRTDGPAAVVESPGGVVVAPMNGQVVKVLAEEGHEVEAGQVVLVLEAMKMENEVTAPLTGVLQRLGVRVGETVQPGRLLFEVVTSQESGVGS